MYMLSLSEFSKNVISTQYRLELNLPKDKTKPAATRYRHESCCTLQALRFGVAKTAYLLGDTVKNWPGGTRAAWISDRQRVYA